MILRRKIILPLLKVKWWINEKIRIRQIAKRQLGQIEKVYLLHKEIEGQFLEAERKGKEKKELELKLGILKWILGEIDNF